MKYRTNPIVKLGEDLDHHNSLHIREQADKIIMNKNIKYIIFDFSGTDFMDSSGIGLLWGVTKSDFYWRKCFVTS